MRKSTISTLILILFFCVEFFWIQQILAKSKEEEYTQAEKEKYTQVEKEETQVLMEPIFKIEKITDELFSIELRDVELSDLFRVLAHDHNLNILIDKEVEGKITASFTNITLEEALEAIIEISNLVLQKKDNIIKVSPNLITKTFILEHVEVKKLLETPTAGREETKGGVVEGEETKEGIVVARVNTIYDLLSDKGKILLGIQPNSIMVIDYPSNIGKIEEFLKIADVKMATQVFRLKHLSVKELFSELSEREREERKKEREERREELEEIRAWKGAEGKGEGK